MAVVPKSCAFFMEMEGRKFLLFGMEKTLVINFLVWFLKLLLHHSPTEESWKKKNILKYSNPNLL